MSDTEVVREVRSTSSGVAWLALLIATIALAVGIVAYNRTGKDIQDSAKDTVNGAANSVEQAIE